MTDIFDAERRAREADNAARSIRAVLALIALWPNDPVRWLALLRSTLKGTALYEVKS